MTDRFGNHNGFDSAPDSNVIPELFPPLGEDLQFDSMTMAASRDNHSDNASDDLLWHDYGNHASQRMQDAGGSSSNSSAAAAPMASAIAGPSNSSTGAAESSSSVFNISWGGDDRPPAELHLDQETEPVSRKPLPKPRGVRRLPEPEPAEDGTIDEDTLRRRRNTYAARRSRMKKFLKIESLENRVNQLQTENAKLVLNNALLESEKRGWIAKEAEYKRRIKWLEETQAYQEA